MNEPAGQLQFGPNPLTPVSSVPGGWYSTTLNVQISYNGTQSSIQPIVYGGAGNAIIDSGGLTGYVPDNFTLPSSLSWYTSGDNLPVGTTITVYTPTDTELYTTIITNNGLDPYVTSAQSGFSTGIIPFLQGPMYFSYGPTGIGTAIWDYPPST